MQRRPLALMDATQFFLPLIFMAEMMMISHSIIHAFLARGAFPRESLAAFSIAFSIQTMMAGVVVILPLVSISFITDRLSFFRLLRFGWAVTALTTGLMLLIAITPLGDWVYDGLLGAGKEATRQARQASFVFAFILPVVVLRQVTNGLIMQKRKTFLITIATMVRLTSLAGFLAINPWQVSGALAGALALLLCIVLETLFLILMASPFLLSLAPGRGHIIPFPFLK